MSGGSGNASAAVTTSHQAWLCRVAQEPHGFSVEDSVTRGGRYHSLMDKEMKTRPHPRASPTSYVLPTVVITRQGGWLSLTQTVRQQSWTVEEGLGSERDSGLLGQSQGM